MALLLLLNFFSPSHQLSQIKYTLLTHQSLGDGGLRSRDRGEGGGDAMRTVVRGRIPTQKWFLGLDTTLYMCPGEESLSENQCQPSCSKKSHQQLFLCLLYSLRGRNTAPCEYPPLVSEVRNKGERVMSASSSDPLPRNRPRVRCSNHLPARGVSINHISLILAPIIGL